jgi:TetR/AcrR family transcriptional regulator, mexJK operon transcriptional repressor
MCSHGQIAGKVRSAVRNRSLHPFNGGNAVRDGMGPTEPRRRRLRLSPELVEKMPSNLLKKRRTAADGVSHRSLDASRKDERPTPGGERAIKKRKDILDAALQVFLAEGAATNLDTIAVVAGVSKVTIYNHFKTKDALLLEVVGAELSNALAKTEHMIQNSLGSAVDLRVALEELCRAWVKGLRSPRLMNLRILVISQVRRLPELGRVWIETGPDRLHEHIASKLSTLSDRFAVRIPDTKLAALQLAGLIVSPHVMYGPLGGGPDDGLTERLVVNGVDMFLRQYSLDAAPSNRKSARTRRDRPAEKRP